MVIWSNHTPLETILDPLLCLTLNLIIKLLGDGPVRTPTKADLDESVAILRPPGSAINDTKKVKKTKPRVPQPQPEHNTSSFSLTDLKKVNRYFKEKNNI